MPTKTEYQVAEYDAKSGNIGQIITYEKEKDARLAFIKNKNAVELRKVVWTIPKGETWESAGEGHREDITLEEREWPEDKEVGLGENNGDPGKI